MRAASDSPEESVPWPLSTPSPVFVKRQSAAWWVGIVCLVVSVVAISAMMSRSYIAHRALDLDESARLDSCARDTLLQLKPQPQAIDLSLLSNIRATCFQQAFGENQLLDFGIRKAAMLNEQVETPVMLWMVVFITLSGVFLAGVQLLAGYRLAQMGKAAFEQGGTVTVEQTRVSLNSSVTGVIILTISLAFFIVFVKWVYLLQGVTTETTNPQAAVVSVPASSSPAYTPAPLPKSAQADGVPWYAIAPLTSAPSMTKNHRADAEKTPTSPSQAPGP